MSQNVPCYVCGLQASTPQQAYQEHGLPQAPCGAIYAVPVTWLPIVGSPGGAYQPIVVFVSPAQQVQVAPAIAPPRSPGRAFASDVHVGTGSVEYATCGSSTGYAYAVTDECSSVAAHMAIAAGGSTATASSCTSELLDDQMTDDIEAAASTLAMSAQPPRETASQRRRRQRKNAARSVGAPVTNRSRSQPASITTGGSTGHAREENATSTTDEVVDLNARASNRSLQTTRNLLGYLESLAEDDRPAAVVASSSLLRGNVWQWARDPAGCRIVQLALQLGGRAVQACIVAELRGHVREAASSPHANYVVQRVVELLPADMASFVVSELSGFVVATVRHRCGCRVLNRLLEHSSTDARTATLIDEALVDVADLCRHEFGHHVIQCVLEHGIPRQRARVARALRGKLVRMSKNRNASYVVEKALLFCEDDDRNALATELLNNVKFLTLARCQVGCYIIKAMAQLPAKQGEMVRACIRQQAGDLLTVRYGKRLLEDLGLSTASGEVTHPVSRESRE